MIEGSIALLVSFVLNLFVIGVFANTLYDLKYEEAFDQCNATGSIYTEFLVNDEGG